MVRISREWKEDPKVTGEVEPMTLVSLSIAHVDGEMKGISLTFGTYGIGTPAFKVMTIDPAEAAQLLEHLAPYAIAEYEEAKKRAVPETAEDPLSYRD